MDSIDDFKMSMDELNNMTPYDFEKCCDRLDSFVNELNKTDDIKNVDELINILSDFTFGNILYIMSFENLQIMESHLYTAALLHLCNRGYEKECKFYSSILNCYYPGVFDKMMNDLIEKEEYEKCASLQKYKNITKIN